MKMVELRGYRQPDCKELAELFCNTVNTVNAKDYTKEQLAAWTAGSGDLEKWNRSFIGHICVVMVHKGIIVGFGDIDKTGYLDRLYVHADYQGKGVGSAICNFLESSVQGNIVTHASVTALPFFEKRGYKVIKEQHVERHGVLLKNYVMVKER